MLRLNFKDEKHLVSLGVLIFLLISIPLTIITILNSRDSRSKAATSPNDTNFNSQWNMQKIKMPEAWDFTTGSRSIKVAMVGHGLQTAHSDLAANLEAGYSVVSPGSSPTDTLQVRGTTAAGIIAAVGNNGSMVSGINWNVGLVPVMVCSVNDTTCDNTTDATKVTNIATGIRWAADNAIKVIFVNNFQTVNHPEIASAVSYAQAAGAIVVAPSGDIASQPVAYPGSYPGVVAVGGTDSNDALLSSTSRGPNLDLVAPGSSITSTWPPSTVSSSTGTHLAAAHVAGVLGLLLSLPGVTPAEAEQCLYSGVDDLGTVGRDHTFGLGRLNAFKALRACTDSTPPKVGDLNGDSVVNILDLSILLSKWGTNDAAADINDDGVVNVLDLSTLLSKWGT